MSVSSSRLGVLLVESVFRLKVIFILSLVFNSFLVFAAVLSSFYVGIFWGWIFSIIGFIFNSIIILKISRGFQYKELIKNE